MNLMYGRLKAYIQQLTAAVSTASDSHNRVVATTRELAERTTQQEQQLQRLLLEKQRQAQDVQDLQRTYVQEVHQQLKTIKLSQSDVGTESQRTKDIKCKFGGAVADKYQEVVEHLQAIETSQKLASSKEKEKRSAMSKSLGVDKRLLSSMDRGDESRLTTLDKGRHQSTLSLLESGSASMRRDIMRGSRSPTERDASVRTAKPFSSTTSLLGERGAKFERGTLDDPAAETEKVEGGALMDGTKLDVAGDNRVARDKASASFGSTSGGGSGEGVERRTGYDFRSIALVQNELANRLADTRQLETCSLDNTRDQMATLSRLMKGTRSEEADLSIIGIGVDGHSLVDDTQQRGMSLSLFRLAMQIRPDAYHHRRTHSNNSKSLSSSSSSSVWGRKSMDELKVSGQKLIL